MRKPLYGLEFMCELYENHWNSAYFCQIITKTIGIHTKSVRFIHPVELCALMTHAQHVH